MTTIQYRLKSAVLGCALMPCAALAFAAPAAANFIYLAADSTTTITYNNGVDPATTIDGIGFAWHSPNFVFMNVLDSPPGGGGGTNAVSTAVTHATVNLGGQNAAVGLNVPQSSFFFQNNPTGALQEASLKIDFTVTLQADVIGGMLHSFAGYYLIQYNLPGQSTGKFNAEFNFNNITTGQNNILAQQTMEFSKQGESGQSVEQFAASAAPAVVAAGEVVQITGFLEWKWHHVAGNLAGDEDQVGMQFKQVPGPSAIALLFLAGMARSRRRS